MNGNIINICIRDTYLLQHGNNIGQQTAIPLSAESLQQKLDKRIGADNQLF